jgi:hypothetical protein
VVGGDSLRICLSNLDPPPNADDDEKEIRVRLIDLDNGVYEASYMPTLSGRYELSVKIKDVNVVGSPSVVAIRSGAPPDRTLLSPPPPARSVRGASGDVFWRGA